MTPEESNKKMHERLDDLVGLIIRKETSISNIVRDAYMRGYADGKNSVTKPDVKVLIGDEQVYPERDWQSEMQRDYCGD